MEEYSIRFISCFACELERMGMALGRRLKFSPRGDIADVALDHFGWADKVDIADKLDLDLLAAFSAQRQIFVADVLLCLQLFESGLVRFRMGSRANRAEMDSHR